MTPQPWMAVDRVLIILETVFMGDTYTRHGSADFSDIMPASLVRLPQVSGFPAAQIENIFLSICSKHEVQNICMKCLQKHYSIVKVQIAVILLRGEEKKIKEKKL